MQRRLLIALLPSLVIVFLAVPAGLSVQAMDMPASVTGPLALTETAEPPTLTPIPPPSETPVPPTDTPVPPTATPTPQEAGERRQRTALPTETPIPPSPTIAPEAPTPTPTPTPIPVPSSLPRTGEPDGNSSLLLWLGIGVLAIALGGSLIRRRA